MKLATKPQLPTSEIDFKPLNDNWLSPLEELRFERVIRLKMPFKLKTMVSCKCHSKKADKANGVSIRAFIHVPEAGLNPVFRCTSCGREITTEATKQAA